MAKSVFYDAYIFKYLGFNACILVQGIAVIRLLKVSDIKFLLNTFADLKKLFFSILWAHSDLILSLL